MAQPNVNQKQTLPNNNAQKNASNKGDMNDSKMNKLNTGRNTIGSESKDFDEDFDRDEKTTRNLGSIEDADSDDVGPTENIGNRQAGTKEHQKGNSSLKSGNRH